MNSDKLFDARMIDYGEKTFLKKLIPTLELDERLIGGPESDAATIRLDTQAPMLSFKIDRASVPVAVSKGWSNYSTWGRQAVTATCSDILAAGGDPIAFMVCIMVPREWHAQDTADIIYGCMAECKNRQIVFAGGDTKESREPQVVGSAIGITSEGQYLTRKGAYQDQLLVMAGDIGGFMGAFLQLERRQNIPSDQRAAWINYLSYPKAQWQDAQKMNELRIATSAMDVSDGLFDTLRTLTRDELGIVLYLKSVPYHEFALECAEALGIPLPNLIFGSGDWNIVYAVDKKHKPLLESLCQMGNCSLSIVGEFTETLGIRAIDEKGRVFQMEGPVSEHFRHRVEDRSAFMDTIVNGKFFL